MKDIHHLRQHNFFSLIWPSKGGKSARKGNQQQCFLYLINIFLFYSSNDYIFFLSAMAPSIDSLQDEESQRLLGLC